MLRDYRNALALMGVAAGLAACQTTMTSDAKLAANTAGFLGVSSSDVSISDRAVLGPTNTSYVATVRSSGKRYACVMNGGGLMAAGIVNFVDCKPAAR